MGTQLTAVKEFCQNGFKSGKIIPLSFNFPSFQITDDMFKETAMEVVADRVRLGIDSGEYKQEAVQLVGQQVAQGLKSKEYGVKYKEFIDTVSYDGLIAAQESAQNGNTTRQQNNENLFAEKLLPREMNRDDNLNYLEIGRKTLNEVCVGRMKDCLMNIDHLHTFCAPYDENVADTIKEKSKFAATMIMMKEQIPTAYRQVVSSLQNYDNKPLVDSLMNSVNHPDIFVIKEIQSIDPKFVEKNFPKELKELNEINKAKVMFM